MENRPRIRELREARRLTQVELAKRCSLSRQGLTAIESGRADPSVSVALRLAAELGTSVEELFAGGAAPGEIEARLDVASPAHTRLLLARTARGYVAHALARHSQVPMVSADGYLAAARGDRARVTLSRSAHALDDAILVAGCAPILGTLVDRLNRGGGPARFVWLPRSSAGALALLGRGLVHAAGSHLADPGTGEPNRADARRAVPRGGLRLVTLVRWSMGLAVRTADRSSLRRLADLARPRLRLALREPGSGASRVLERHLAASGMMAEKIVARAAIVENHADAAMAVGARLADVGLTIEPVAREQGLSFMELERERFDLVVPAAAAALDGVRRLLDVIASGAFRHEAEALGYGVEDTGKVAVEIA